MPIQLFDGHVPPPYDANAPARLFERWKIMAATQNYPSGVDHYLGDEAVNACKRLFHQPMKLLFLGCGNGTEVKRTLEMGHDSWGVTLNPNNSVWAREELGLWNVYYHDAHLNPVEWNGSFDGVLGFQFLEHTPSPILLLMEVERILRPGGITYFETPGPEGFTGGSNLHHVTCPTRTQAHGWMLKVGFTDIQVEEIGPPDAARHLSIFGRKT